MGRESVLGLRVKVDEELRVAEFETPVRSWARELDPWVQVDSQELYEALVGSTEAHQDLREKGATLAAWLFDDQAKGTLAVVGGDEIRRVELILPEVLQDAPWEIAYDPSWGYLGTQPSLTVVRAPAALMPGPANRSKGQVLTLVGVSLATADYPRLLVTTELAAVGRSLDGSALEVDAVAGIGTWEHTRDSIRRMGARAFHFAGHTDAQSPSLVFATEGFTERADPADAEVIASELSDARTELAVLMVCHGDRPNGVGRHLASRVDGVVAVRSLITDFESTVFAAAFYRSLADGDTADIAAQSGRNTAFKVEGDRLGWAFIVHRARCIPRSVLAPPPSLEEASFEDKSLEDTSQRDSAPAPKTGSDGIGPVSETPQAEGPVDLVAVGLVMLGIIAAVSLTVLGVQQLPDAQSGVVTKAVQAIAMGGASAAFFLTVYWKRFSEANRQWIARLLPLSKRLSAAVLCAALVSVGVGAAWYTWARVQLASCEEGTEMHQNPHENLCDEGRMWSPWLFERLPTDTQCEAPSEPPWPPDGPREGGYRCIAPTPEPAPSPPEVVIRVVHCPSPGPNDVAVVVVIVTTADGIETQTIPETLGADGSQLESEVAEQTHRAVSASLCVVAVAPETPQPDGDPQAWIRRRVLEPVRSGEDSPLTPGIYDRALLQVVQTQGSGVLSERARWGPSVEAAELAERVAGAPRPEGWRPPPISVRYPEDIESLDEAQLWRSEGFLFERLPGETRTIVWSADGSSWHATLDEGDTETVGRRQISLRPDGEIAIRPVRTCREQRRSQINELEERLQGRLRGVASPAGASRSLRIAIDERGRPRVVGGPPVLISRASPLLGSGYATGCESEFSVSIPRASP